MFVCQSKPLAVPQGRRTAELMATTRLSRFGLCLLKLAQILGLSLLCARTRRSVPVPAVRAWGFVALE